MESPTKADSRLARRATTSAVSTSPRGRRSCCSSARRTAIHGGSRSPTSSGADRPNAKEHIAFGRGIHSCPGAPLAVPRAASASK